MKKIRRVIALLVVVGCISTSSLGVFAADICRHPAVITTGANISSWNTTHQVTTHIDSSGAHVETCYVYHWVERVTHTCKYCGYEVGHEDFFHENHSISHN